MLPMTFGEKVGKLSVEKGWNAAELARRLGISANTTGRWLVDERRPYNDVLLNLARLFDVQVDFLIDDAQEEIPSPSISDDEAFVLRLVRASGLTGDDVARALTGYAHVRAERPAATVAPSVRTVDTTSSFLVREREAKRPAPKSHHDPVRHDEPEDGANLPPGRKGKR